MLKTFGFFAILAQLTFGSTLIAQGPDPSQTLGVRTQTAGVRVVVDSRIELMSIVQLLSDYHLVSRYDSPYKRDARAYFAQFSGHPAVALFREMSEAGFAFNNVPAVMLARTEVPALERRADVRQDVRDAAGGEEKIEELIQALRRFAEDTDFLAFYRAHSGTYTIAAEKTRPAAESALRILEKYTGLTFEASTVVLGPLLHDGGFAAIYDIDGQPEAYALIGPMKSDPDRVPSFGDPGRLLSLVGHEFAHLAVDPLTSRYQQIVEGYSAAHAPIAEAMRRNAYGQWTVVVSEHIIRAITTRIVFREHGEEAGRRELDSEVQRGFAYVPRLVELLEEYEGERSRYPTLAEYFPRLLSAFETPVAPL